MLVNEAERAGLLQDRYDVVIVGAGVVGLFTAVQLERRGIRVLLIEGGDLTPDTRSNARYTTIGNRRHSSVDAGRAMGLGGTGLLWGGQLSEFSQIDVEGGKGYWPIDYSELRTLYDRVYAALGLPPRMADDIARARFGGDEGTINGVDRIFSYWLPNPNLAGIFRETIANSKRLTVLVRTKVVGINFDGHGSATGFRIRTGNHETTVAADRFVIAGGVVESCRLALAAQREPRCPWRDNRKIGVAFQDHLGGEFGTLLVKNEQVFRERFETGFWDKTKYMPKLRFSGASSGQTLSVCAFPIFHSSMSEHIANLKLLIKAFRSGSTYSKWSELPASIIKIGLVFLPLIRRYLRNRRIMAMMDRGVTIAFQCEQVARTTSRITLADEREAEDGLPPVLVDWQVGAEELEFLPIAAERIAAYFAESGVAELQLDREYLLNSAGLSARTCDTSHPGGGLCMGETLGEGATDSDGRIWGAANVYATGASTLATSGEANITLTALAMALRLTDHLVSTSVSEAEQDKSLS